MLRTNFTIYLVNQEISMNSRSDVNIFIPRRWTGPPLISFCFISAPSRCFSDLNLEAVSAHFWSLYFFNVTDGWWMGPKMLSDFASKVFRWTSGNINVRKFGKSAINFFLSELQLSKSGGDLMKKRFSDFSQKFFGWSLGDINEPTYRFLWRHVS